MMARTLVARYMRRSRTQDAVMAAVILRFCPEFIWEVKPDETVDHYLRRIGAGTIRDDVVLSITQRAKVNGSRLVSSLKVWQRYALADQLERFAQGGLS